MESLTNWEIEGKGDVRWSDESSGGRPHAKPQAKFSPMVHKTSRASLIGFAQSCVVQAVTYLLTQIRQHHLAIPKLIDLGAHPLGQGQV